MNVNITCSTKNVPEVKGLSVLKATFLKEKTKLEFAADRKSEVAFSATLEDINLLKIAGLPVKDFVVTVSECPAFGKVFNRSIPAFGKIGLTLQKAPWEQTAGVVTVGQSIVGSDLPALIFTCFKMTIRACAPISGTQHPFTLFDLQQSIGIIYDAKQGDEDAKSVKDWSTVRELVLLEEAKELKKLEKESQKAESAKTAKVAKVKAAEVQASPKAVLGNESDLAAVLTPKPAPEKNAVKTSSKAATGKKKSNSK